MYNVVWTSIPIFAIAMFDRDVSHATARKLPQLYFLGIRGFYWNRWTVIRWFFEAMYESVAISLMAIYALPHLGVYGDDPSVYYIGAHTLTIVVIVVNLKLYLWMWEHTWWNNLCIIGSIVLWWTCLFPASLPSMQVRRDAQGVPAAPTPRRVAWARLRLSADLSSEALTV